MIGNQLHHNWKHYKQFVFFLGVFGILWTGGVIVVASDSVPETDSSVTPKEHKMQTAKPYKFKFMQISDVHVGAPTNQPVHKRLQAAVELANSLSVDLVIDTGDIATHPVYAATDEYLKEFQIYKKHMSALKMPYYVVPGNHDIGYFNNDLDPRNVTFADGDLLAKRFLKEVGPLNQSFVFRGCRFLLINNNPSYGHRPGYVSARQLAWIRHELNRSRQQKQKTFLFMHIPVLHKGKGKPWGGSSQKLVELVKQYQVPLVAYGHEHRFIPTLHEGVLYMMCPDLKVKEHNDVLVYEVYETHFDVWRYNVLTSKKTRVGTYPFPKAAGKAVSACSTAKSI